MKVFKIVYSYRAGKEQFPKAEIYNIAVIKNCILDWRLVILKKKCVSYKYIGKSSTNGSHVTLKHLCTTYLYMFQTSYDLLNIFKRLGYIDYWRGIWGNSECDGEMVKRKQSDKGYTNSDNFYSKYNRIIYKYFFHFMKCVTTEVQNPEVMKLITSPVKQCNYSATGCLIYLHSFLAFLK